MVRLPDSGNRLLSPAESMLVAYGAPSCTSVAHCPVSGKLGIFALEDCGFRIAIFVN